MRKYELMFIMRPDLDETAVEEIKARLQKVLAEFDGTLNEEAEGWGKRRMAYSIADYQEGDYYLWRISGEPETVQELDRVIKLSDKILRHLIVRVD